MEIKTIVGGIIKVDTLINKQQIIDIINGPQSGGVTNDKRLLIQFLENDEFDQFNRYLIKSSFYSSDLWLIQSLMNGNVHTPVSNVNNSTPIWSTNSGTDQYGKWAEFEIAGVVQRMRWIEPTTFLMGSPDTEVNHCDEEHQHSVTLTTGYWLADTTCTQELWQSVMGTNPSQFNTSKQNPVERISWNDCKEFFTKVNQLQPNLNLRFPTEAEWENACRAGTTTPFSFGDNITTDLVNYDGNYPYNGAPIGIGIYRKSTIGVTDLPCNQWGLYQMHGNVWEWCSDWYDDYDMNVLVDPTGPATGSYRVLRGGSWYYGGVRSARRNGLVPPVADDGIGFRLARGQ